MATLKRTGNQTVVPLSFVDETDEVVQRVVARIRTFEGEWTFNTRAGIDWLGFTASKEVQDAQIAAKLKREIDQTKGVRRSVVLIEDDQTYDVTIYLDDNVEEGGTVGLEVDPKSASPVGRVKL